MKMNNFHYSQLYTKGENLFQFSSQSNNQTKTNKTLSDNYTIHISPKAKNTDDNETIIQRSNFNYHNKVPSPKYSNSQSLVNQILSPNEATKEEYSRGQYASIRVNGNNLPINKRLQSNLHGVKQSNNTQPIPLRYYLPPKTNDNKKTLVLDLDETLVHSAFKPFSFKSDITLRVNVNQTDHLVHVLKRPHVDSFLKRMALHYELIIFTASISQYANPLLNQLDKNQLISHRLFREHCVNAKGLYIKDLNRLGRDLKDMIILDNNPVSYAVNHENGLPIPTWHYDKGDAELIKLIPLLEYLAYVDDVREFIIKAVNQNYINFGYVNEVINEGIMIDDYHLQQKNNHNHNKRTRSIDINKEYYIANKNSKDYNNTHSIPHNHKSRTVAPSPLFTLVTKEDEQQVPELSYETYDKVMKKDTRKPQKKAIHYKSNSYTSHKIPLGGYESDYNPIYQYNQIDQNQRNVISPNINVNIVNQNIGNLCVNNESYQGKNINANHQEAYNPFLLPKEAKKDKRQGIENDSDSMLTMDDNLLQENDKSRNKSATKSGHTHSESNVSNNYYKDHRSFSKNNKKGEQNDLTTSGDYYLNRKKGTMNRGIERDGREVRHSKQFLQNQDLTCDSYYKGNNAMLNQNNLTPNEGIKEQSIENNGRIHTRSPSPFLINYYREAKQQQTIPKNKQQLSQKYNQQQDYLNYKGDSNNVNSKDNNGSNDHSKQPKDEPELQTNYCNNYQLNNTTNYSQILKNDNDRDRNNFIKRNYSQDWRIKRSDY